MLYNKIMKSKTRTNSIPYVQKNRGKENWLSLCDDLKFITENVLLDYGATNLPTHRIPESKLRELIYEVMPANIDHFINHGKFKTDTSIKGILINETLRANKEKRFEGKSKYINAEDLEYSSMVISVKNKQDYDIIKRKSKDWISSNTNYHGLALNKIIIPMLGIELLCVIDTGDDQDIDNINPVYLGYVILNEFPPTKYKIYYDIHIQKALGTSSAKQSRYLLYVLANEIYQMKKAENMIDEDGRATLRVDKQTKARLTEIYYAITGTNPTNIIDRIGKALKLIERKTFYLKDSGLEYVSISNNGKGTDLKFRLTHQFNVKSIQSKIVDYDKNKSDMLKSKKACEKATKEAFKKGYNLEQKSLEKELNNFSFCKLDENGYPKYIINNDEIYTDEDNIDEFERISDLKSTLYINDKTINEMNNTVLMTLYTKGMLQLNTSQTSPKNLNRKQLTLFKSMHDEVIKSTDTLNRSDEIYEDIVSHYETNLESLSYSFKKSSYIHQMQTNNGITTLDKTIRCYGGFGKKDIVHTATPQENDNKSSKTKPTKTLKRNGFRKFIIGISHLTKKHTNYTQKYKTSYNKKLSYIAHNRKVFSKLDYIAKASGIFKAVHDNITKKYGNDGILIYHNTTTRNKIDKSIRAGIVDIAASSVYLETMQSTIKKFTS